MLLASECASTSGRCAVDGFGTSLTRNPKIAARPRGQVPKQTLPTKTVRIPFAGSDEESIVVDMAASSFAKGERHHRSPLQVH